MSIYARDVLKPTFSEMITSLNEVIKVGDYIVTVLLAFLAADALDRALLLQFYSSTGYCGLPECVHHGLCYVNRVIYLDVKPK